MTESFDENPFFDCKTLQEIKLTSSDDLSQEEPKQSGSAISNDSDNVTVSKLPESLRDICSGAFENCYNFEYLELPRTIQKIEGKVFSNCVSLRWVTLPDSLESILEFTFCRCCALERVEFTETENTSFDEVGRYAFENCSLLKSIHLPSTVTAIESGVFRYCSKLEEINFPIMMEWVGLETFKGCTKLLRLADTNDSLEDGENGSNNSIDNEFNTNSIHHE